MDEKKVSRVPVTQGEDGAESRTSRQAIKRGIRHWLRTRGATARSSVLKATSVQVVGSVVLKTSEGRRADLTVHKKEGLVDYFEYRCACGHQERFDVVR